MFILRLLIQTNLFIAIAAVCFLLTNVYLLQLPIVHLKEIILLVFSSTWLVYQFSRWFYHRKNAFTDTNDSVFGFLERYPKWNIALLIIAIVLVILSALFIHKNVFYFLAIIGCISFLYPIPIVKYQGKWIKLREIPFLKLFIIALVWSVSCVILPILELNICQENFVQYILLFIIQYLFILFITLPFDMNDFQNDREVGIKTIPTVFGLDLSKKLLTALCLIINILWIVFFYCFQIHSFSHIILLIAYILMNVFLLIYARKNITRATKDQVKYIYDGSMIVQFLLTFIILNFL